SSASNRRRTRSTRTGRSATRTTTAGASARTGRAASRTAGTTGTADAAKVDAPEITLADGSVPGRLELAGFVVVRNPVVDHDVRIADAADRAVDVVERRAIPAGKRAEFTGEGPAALLRREVHRLGVFKRQL